MTETRMRPAVAHRLEAAGLLLVAAVVLGLSWWLTPSASGHGTHEQLLLIPCGFRWITGLPCPMCGMTTSFALMARGELLDALRAHVLGPALYLTTWVVGIRSGWALIGGARALPGWVFSERAARWFLGIVLVAWGINVTLAILAW